MPVSWFVRQLYPSNHRSKSSTPPAIERVKSGDGSLSSSSTSSSIPTSFLSRKRRSAMSSDRGALIGGRGVKAGPTSADGLPRPKPGIGRDARADDLWRVENILDNGQPPAKADWWIRQSGENTKEDGVGNGNTREDSSMKEVTSQDEGDGDSQGSPMPQPPQENRTFHNCGLSNWEKSRAKWRAPPPPAPQAPSSFSAGEDGGDTTVSETTTSIESAEYGMGKRRQPPPPVRYDDVVRGLTQVSRTFELPGRMTLPDIVDVFVDIWECEKDY